MNKILLVIKREYLTRVRKKSFIIMTLLGPILIAGLISSVIWFSLKEDEGTNKILIVDYLYPVFQTLKSSDNLIFEYSNITEEEAYKLFPESDYSAILIIPTKILTLNTALLYFKKQPSMRLIKQIESSIEHIVENEKLKEKNISREQFNEINTNFNLQSYMFSESGEIEKVENERSYIGFFLGMTIYLFIFMYGIQVMRGVIEEKTNRIIEVIITSIRPMQLMFGKIIGIALVGLTQFLLWVILTFTITTTIQTILYKNKFEKFLQEVNTSSEIQNPFMQSNNISANTTTLQLIDENHILNRINFPLIIGMFLLYFMGGYLLYASLFAAIGAASDSETDTQQFMIPVTIPLLIAYLIAFSVIENPSGPAAFWGSIIPFTSPVIMMVRIAIGIESSQIWHIYLSLFLLFACFVFCVWISGKIYRVGILMYGKKITYRELWKWIRFKS